MKFQQIYTVYKKAIFSVLAGTLVLLLFGVFSYAVDKGILRSFDFDTTIRLQNHIPRRFDLFLSYFSLLGSAEATTFILLVLLLGLALIKKQIFIGFVFFFVAVFVEIIGKTYVINPAPPFFLLRNNLGLTFPSFYIHTNYSYPSGHMTRTAFLVIVLLFFIISSNVSRLNKYIFGFSTAFIGIVMFISRIYLAEHWFSDVFGGLLLGTAFALVGLFFWQIQIKLFPPVKEPSLRLQKTLRKTQTS